ncbi:MAG: hypothetical protein ACYCX7_09740, partial [Solirubrobacteraceae bacterium]
LPEAKQPPKIPGQTRTPTTGGATGASGGQSSSAATGSGEAGREASRGQGKAGGGGRQPAKSEEGTCTTSTTTSTSDTTPTTATTATTDTTSSTGRAGAGAGNEESSTQTTSSSSAEEAREIKELEAAESAREGCAGAKSAPILLTKHAASTYDPNAYPATGYAGPQLATDGNLSTAWTATAAPEIAPKVQAGLLIDLHREREIAKVALSSRALGMTVQIFGTTQRTAPKSIEGRRWVKLSRVHLVEQRSSTIKLERKGKIRQLLVWVLRAPEVEPKVEGEVVQDSAAINEVQLYEPR